MCHPVLAWHRMRPAARVSLALVYVSLSYLTTLVALLALHR
jgi:hypothetical protein